jgi:hypothetical protein
VLSFQATETIFIRIWTQDSFSGLSSRWQFFSWCHSSIVLSYWATETIFTRTQSKDFQHCGLYSCNLSTKTNNFGLATILLLCLVSELKKLSSPGLKPRTVFQGCGLCFCNLLAPKENNFGLGTIILLCLVSKLQKQFSLSLETRTLFPGLDLSKISSWSQCISMPSLGQICFCSWAISEHVHTQTYSQLYIRRNEDILEEFSTDPIKKKSTQYVQNWLDHLRRVKNIGHPKQLSDYHPIRSRRRTA